MNTDWQKDSITFYILNRLLYGVPEEVCSAVWEVVDGIIENPAPWSWSLGTGSVTFIDGKRIGAVLKDHGVDVPEDLEHYRVAIQ